MKVIPPGPLQLASVAPLGLPRQQESAPDNPEALETFGSGEGESSVALLPDEPLATSAGPLQRAEHRTQRRVLNAQLVQQKLSQSQAEWPNSACGYEVSCRNCQVDFKCL